MAFGNLGVSAGTVYPKRAAVRAAGLHRHLMRGIAGRPAEGADAIVMSGGYDDIDLGDEVIYTGEGGQDESGNPVADQELTGGNAALVTSELEGLPVRVIRGWELRSPFAPPDGYRYDGLFYVDVAEAGVVMETATGVEIGYLRTHPDHVVANEYLAYHRAHWAGGPGV